MGNLIRLGALCTLLTGVAVAQPPLIYSRSIYNAASFMPAGVPSGAIAQGSIFSIFGGQIGPAKAVTATSFPLGATLGGVSVNIVQGSTIVTAYPVYVSASQINVIMPSTAPLGMASVQVVVNNAKSNLAPVQIVPSSFGIFTAKGTGIGPGVLYNFVAQNNQPINSPTVTAKNGQVITLWGTGLGPLTSGADNVAPTAGDLPVQVQVFVGGQPAAIQYSGRSTCCAGVDQIVFTVPSNAPTGCWVPVYVKTLGTTISNFVTMAIEPKAGVCTTDVLPQVTSSFVTGLKIAEALFTRADTYQDVGVLAPVDIMADYHVSFAFEPDQGQFPFNPAIAFPPSGTCTVYANTGDMLNGSPPLPGMAPTSAPLDLGAPFLLTGNGGEKTLSYGFSGARAGYIGGQISNNILPSTLFLNPGSYTVQGFGGMDVGPFSTTFTIPQPLIWSNRLQTNVVPRSQPLTVSWTGGDSGQVIALLGLGEDLPTNSSVAFVCIAPLGSSSFTIPTDMMANMPATRANPLQSKDVIYMLGLSGSSLKNIAAKGLDVGLTSFYSIIGKTVVLQ